MLEEIPNAFTTGGSITVVTALLHFLRQIRLAVVSMEKNFKEMNNSIHELNSSIVKIVTERDRDKEEIDRLRDDVKEMYNLVNLNFKKEK